ncbi:unnamed protein product [Schistosoma turkestanicum]|nr:unnamed protein product [Schistosoma turkestanicum]
MESWQRLTDSPFSRVNHQAVCLDGRIFVFGGFNSQMFDVDYNERQIDTFIWDIHTNKWEQLPYPLLLKSWDCTLKSWGPDPILESSGSIQPSLRFGHTVVAWRGRGWLFGGRMQQRVCSNQLYMFDPGSKSPCQPFNRSTVSGSLKLNHFFNTKKFHPPCWAEVRGTVGSVPSARDGHSATVLENAMFVFGGFEDVFDNYDNSVYRLDFITWNWTRIEIRDDLLPFSDLSLNVPMDTNRSGHDQTSHPRTPLPRDFACLISHHGRIFLFGGRSKSPNHPSCDVYDSILWELIPLVNVSDYSSSDTANIPKEQKLIPAKCDVCDAEMIDYLGTTSGGLLHILWEEETGNWSGPDFWATSPPRPCCLWKFIHHNAENKSYAQHNYKLPSNYRSRWSGGSAVWIILHPGHGLQSPEVLLSQIFNKVNESTCDSKSSVVQSSSSTSLKLNSPYGRRSLSHWSYNGNLYIAFGAIRSQTGRSLQLHYQDVWRFNLSTLNWMQLSYIPSIKSSNLHMHVPSARRRAVTCLYLAPPSIPHHGYDPTLIKQHPRVFLFGGTQPKALNENLSLISNTNHNSRRSVNESSTSYGMFPDRSLYNVNWGNNRTQNEVLGLRTIHSTLKSFVSILCIQSNSSNHHNDENNNNVIISNSITNSSLSTFAVPSSLSSSNTPMTNFYLIIMIPSYLRDSHVFSELSSLLIHDFILLSNLFVISFDELSQLSHHLTTSSFGNNLTDDDDSSSFIKYLECMLSHQSTVKNPHTTSHGTSTNYSVTADEIIHLFHVTRIILANNNCSSHKTTNHNENSNNNNSSERNSVPYPLSRFHIFFVANCPTSCSCLLSSSESNQNYKPVILKHYTFYQDSHEVINFEEPCINHTSATYISSQLINICLKSVVYILFEAVERASKYAHVKYHTTTLDSLSSTMYNTAVFRDVDEEDHSCQHNQNFLAYKTFFLYSDIDMDELENYATYVYINVYQITSVVNNKHNNDNSFSSLSSTSKLTYNPNILCYTVKNSVQQTVASVLLKYLNFIQTSFHFIFEDSKLSLNQQEILQSSSTDPVHLYSDNNANTTNNNDTFSMTSIHFTTRDSSIVNSAGHISGRYLESSTSNSNGNPHVAGSSQYFLSETLALEILNNENIFNFTGIGMYSNPPRATVDDDEINHESDVVGEDDEYDNGNVSVDADYSEIHCIPNVGVLSKGTEKLIELSDCYSFSFDTSLYDLCLRVSSELAQEPVVTQILPSTIVRDLKFLYSSHIYSMRRSRFG